jgi:putative endonuclease
MSRSRRSREAAGRRAEWLAALWLLLKGYRLLARRVRTPGGEIDLIMRRGDALVFVEVKARATLDSGLAALHAGGMNRVAAAARSLAPRYGRGWRRGASMPSSSAPGRGRCIW